jgi:hypothetical protein
MPSEIIWLIERNASHHALGYNKLTINQSNGYLYSV